MGYFEFPNTRNYDKDLGWIIRALKEIADTLENFVSINAIKYADPIQWNITTQYEKNTIVIDPQTGTAYISVAAVPSGVSISNTDYWTVVFDLGSFVTKTAKNFTSNYEEETTLTATISMNAGEWVVWGDTLYRTLVNITAGDAYTIGSNIETITIEDIKNELLSTIDSLYDEISDRVGSLSDLTTSDITSIVLAINSIITERGALSDLTTSDITSIVNAINSIITERGALSDLTTSDITSIVNAINSALTDAKAYTDELAKKPASNMISLEYVSTLMSLDSRYADFSGNYYYNVIQGMCYHDNKLVCVRIDESARTNDGKLQVFNMSGISNGTLYDFPVGHGNSITYADGYYYVAWSTTYDGTSSTNVTKIPEDFSSYTIITAPLQIPALSYDEENDIFYAFAGGKIYTLDNTLSTILSTVTADERAFSTTLHANAERQNGCYYNGYWIELYLYPTMQVWYDVTSGECVKIYNYPRHLKYNGFCTYEPENIAYNPDDDMFYSSFYARCGEGDISSNVFCKFNPYSNSSDGDDRYYLRNSIVGDIYVDPTIDDNAYMNGKSDHPFKYIQNAIDLCKEFTDLVFQINVITSDNYLGCIAATNSNNFNIILASGSSKDNVETIPSIVLFRCSNVCIFNMYCGSITIQYSNDIQIAGNTVTDSIYVNRAFDVDLETSSCDSLTLRYCGFSMYSMTYNTITKTGLIAAKPYNLPWCDSGQTTSATITAGSYVDVAVTFASTAPTTPNVVACAHNTTATIATAVGLKVVVYAKTTSGCTIRCWNNDATDHAVGIEWMAMAKL